MMSRENDIFGKPRGWKLERDLDAGRAGRDEGMERALEDEEDWAQAVMELIIKLPFGWHGIAEDIRIMAHDAGIPRPHSHKCWGGLTSRAIKGGWLRPTGALKPMRLPDSHARKSPEYIRVNPNQRKNGNGVE